MVRDFFLNLLTTHIKQTPPLSKLKRFQTSVIRKIGCSLLKRLFCSEVNLSHSDLTEVILPYGSGYEKKF